MYWKLVVLGVRCIALYNIRKYAAELKRRHDSQISLEQSYFQVDRELARALLHA